MFMVPMTLTLAPKRRVCLAEGHLQRSQMDYTRRAGSAQGGLDGSRVGYIAVDVVDARQLLRLQDQLQAFFDRGRGQRWLRTGRRAADCASPMRRYSPARQLRKSVLTDMCPIPLQVHATGQEASWQRLRARNPAFDCDVVAGCGGFVDGQHDFERVQRQLPGGTVGHDCCEWLRPCPRRRCCGQLLHCASAGFRSSLTRRRVSGAPGRRSDWGRARKACLRCP